MNNKLPIAAGFLVAIAIAFFAGRSFNDSAAGAGGEGQARVVVAEPER